MKKIIVSLILLIISANGGCKLIGIMSAPSPHEKKIPAEYKLSEMKGKKILVLVNQPVWISSSESFRSELTETINEFLVDKAEVKKSNLIAYEKLSEFNMSNTETAFLTPSKVGKALNADLILFILLDQYQLNKVVDADYYKGYLSAKCVIINTSTEERIWPQSDETKPVKVGFELERTGRDAAVTRLARSFSYCLTRYFYNCPIPKFKIADDRSNIILEQWE